jgi:enterochelin esterase-like enzyme
VLLTHGARGGALFRDALSTAAALYLPPHVGDRVYPLVYVVGAGPAVRLARHAGLPEIGDQLEWDGTTPKFAALVLDAKASAASSTIGRWSKVRLPVRTRAPRPVIHVPGAFPDAVVHDLTSAQVQRAMLGADGVLPGWTRILSGPAGGTIWQGVIPNHVVHGTHRASLVYLPPNTDPHRRYPVIFLLHGLRGAPYSFVGGLRLAAIADTLIARHRVPPFVAVLPPAGRSISFDGEWTGPWARYVVHDVLPWARRHLPIHHTRSQTAVAGLSAGGFGAVDMGLQDPHLFGTLEAWSGYYHAPHDGSLRGASPELLAANDPTLLAHLHAGLLRRLGTRIYVSAGSREPVDLADTRAFAALLRRLHVRHELAVVPGGHQGRTWRAGLPDALRYAFA